MPRFIVLDALSRRELTRRRALRRRRAHQRPYSAKFGLLMQELSLCSLVRIKAVLYPQVRTHHLHNRLIYGLIDGLAYQDCHEREEKDEEDRSVYGIVELRR